MPEKAAEIAAWTTYEHDVWARGLDYYRERLRALGVRGTTALDVGYGPGQWSAAAAAEGFDVVGCDRHVRRISRATGTVWLVGADATRLPFQGGSFDLVMCNLVLPYVAVEACIAEAARLLRPDGIFFGICHGPGYYLLQALREIRRTPRGTVRRLLVLGYTLAHRLLGLQSYHYETFQTPGQISRTLRAAGFEVRRLRIGGHPVLPEQRVLGMPVFFEFLARRSGPLPEPLPPSAGAP